MPSGATAPPAARASSRSMRLVNRMASRTRKTAMAVAVSSRIKLRRKIMTGGFPKELTPPVGAAMRRGGGFLTFSADFADNPSLSPLGQTNATAGSAWSDGIYHKKRQSRETAQRLRRRRRVRQPQAFAVGGAHRSRFERLRERNHPARRHGGEARQHAPLAQRAGNSRRS